MTSKIKLNEVVLTSPNGLVEKIVNLTDGGDVYVNGLKLVNQELTTPILKGETTLQKVVRKTEATNKIGSYEVTKVITVSGTTPVLKFTVGCDIYDGFSIEVLACGINNDVNSFSTKKVWLGGRGNSACSVTQVQDLSWSGGTNQSASITCVPIGNDAVGVYFASQNASICSYMVNIKVCGSEFTFVEN